MVKHKLQAITFILLGLSVITFVTPESTQAQNTIPQIAATTCAVMAGQRKLDRETLQYLSLLDEDLADANPIALALYREVIKQCPKTYLNFQQRKRARNPWQNNPLVQPNPTQLYKP